MADLQGLMNDPRFRALPIERQRAVLAKIQQRTALQTPQQTTRSEGPESAESTLRNLNPIPLSGDGEEVLGTLRNLPAEMAQEVAGYLPAAGGIAGGVLGSGAGPAGTIGGAGAGTAAGEMGRRAIMQAVLGREAPSSAGEALAGIGAAGAEGAAVTALGMGAGMVAKPIARGALAGGKVLLGDNRFSRALSAATEAAAPKATAAIKEKVGQFVGKMEVALKPAAKAKIVHAVKRSVKEVGEEAPKAAAPATKAATKAATPAAPDVPVEDILSDMTKRVTSLRDLGIDPKDISKSLVKHYERTGRGAGLTAGKMRSLVDEIIKQSPKAETSLADDMANKVIGWAKESGFSRAQMDDALRREYSVELTPSKAREVVDLILDTQKIGPKRTAAEMGMSTNEQIRNARARVAQGVE